MSEKKHKQFNLPPMEYLWKRGEFMAWKDWMHTSQIADFKKFMTGFSMF